MRIILILIFSLVLFSCEEREVIIPEYIPPETDKITLVEELSGVRCTNCPAGAAELNRIQDQFGKNVVIVTYHTTFLGFPIPESNQNFLTQEAEQLEDYLGDYLGKPAATFDRLDASEESKFNTNVGEWAGIVEAQLQDAADLLLDASLSLNEESRSINADITLDPKVDIQGDLSISVLITESHIIDAQLYPSGEVKTDHEHNHIFRKFLTNLTGQGLSGNLTAGESQVLSFQTELDELWNLDHLELVAFVERKEGGRPVQAIQAGKWKLKS